MITVDFNIKKDKSILLLWSGGFDSTLLLIEALRQGYTIRTLYFKVPNNELKTIRETYKRDLIKEELEQKFSNIINDTIIDIPPIYKSENARLTQPFLWLTHSILQLNEDDYLCLGYIKEDCFWHINTDWKKAFYSLQKCVFVHNSNYTQPLFPLEWFKKAECLEYFKTYYKKIYKMCYTCECPKIERGRIVNCNVCEPCKNFLKSERRSIE